MPSLPSVPLKYHVPVQTNRGESEPYGPYGHVIHAKRGLAEFLITPPQVMAYLCILAGFAICIDYKTKTILVTHAQKQDIAA